MSKRLIIKMLASSGAADVMFRLSRSKLRVLMYHGVSPRSLTPAEFERQLDYITSRFELFWASEIPELLGNLGTGRKPPLVLTFDDGLRNNLTYVAPLLAERGAKATFYFVSDLLDGSAMLWNHELLCRLSLARNGDLPEGIGPFPGDRAARLADVRAFIEQVKRLPNSRRLELIECVRSVNPSPDYEPWMLDEYVIMSGEELRQLPDVVEIGAHSRTHPLLPTVADDEEARHEIQTCGDVLESLTGKPVRSFCYPNGEFTERDVKLAQERYDAALTVIEGFVEAGDSPFTLKRIPSADDFTGNIARLLRTKS